MKGIDETSIGKFQTLMARISATIRLEFYLVRVPFFL
jgi:hypothetical protein